MRQLPNLVGQRFGMLTVVEQAGSGKDGKRRWVCRCDCGRVTTVLGQNLTRGGTVSCGCKKRNDLTGQKIGQLTVLGRSDRYSSRGSRKTRLWECLCDCGQLTYKATDTLTNPETSMCKDCAGKYGAEKARANAGYAEGTQLAKIRVESDKSDNLSGVRGVYYDGKRGKYRARIKFKRKSTTWGILPIWRMLSKLANMLRKNTLRDSWRLMELRLIHEQIIEELPLSQMRIPACILRCNMELESVKPAWDAVAV